MADKKSSDHGRFRAVVPEDASSLVRDSALVVVDMTKFDSHPDHGFARVLAEEGASLSYYWDRLESLTVPNCERLVDAYRNAGGRIVYTRVGGQFDDYGDSLKHLRQLHRRAGTQRGTDEYALRDEFVPRPGEAIVDKPGSSAFTTGNLDALLRNAGVRTVVFCGVVTNACVLLSALSAWDLGYSVQIVDDACAADSQEMHESALAVADWLGCDIIQTDDVLTSLSGAKVAA